MSSGQGLRPGLLALGAAANASLMLACGSPVISPAGVEVSPASSVWSNAGVMLAAGHRAAITAFDAGWVLTQPFTDNTLTLTEFSLKDGSQMASTMVDQDVGAYSGAGLASDNSGNLWITYTTRLVRYTTANGQFARWDIPATQPAIASENPLVGNAQASAWDQAIDGLVFVKNDDQRLYSFNPGTSQFGVVAELPVTTSYISSVGVGSHGDVVVTGTLAGATTFTPTAVHILDSKEQLIPNAAGVCSEPSGLAIIDANGVVSVNGSVAGTVATPHSTGVPVACDSTSNVFEVSVAAGNVTIVRLAGAGSIATVVAPLRPITVHGPGGVSEPSFADPGVTGIVPDLSGGVWIVTEAGFNPATGLGSSYPSLAHVAFAG